MLGSAAGSYNHGPLSSSVRYLGLAKTLANGCMRASPCRLLRAVTTSSEVCGVLQERGASARGFAICESPASEERSHCRPIASGGPSSPEAPGP